MRHLGLRTQWMRVEPTERPHRCSVATVCGGVWKCSCRVGSVPCGPGGLWPQSALISSEEVSCCKWKVPVEFIHPFPFPFSFFSCHHLLLFFPFCFDFPSFKSSVPFPAVCRLYLSLSFIWSLLPPFLCSPPSLSLSFCLISILSLFPSICFLRSPSVVFSSSAAARQTNRTVNLHRNTRVRHHRSTSRWRLLLRRLWLPASSLQEPLSTGCTRIIESSIDCMGNIDSRLFSILTCDCTSSPVFTSLSLSLYTSVTLSLRLLPASCSFLWSQVVAAVIRRIEWFNHLLIYLSGNLSLPVCLSVHHCSRWPRGESRMAK